MRVWKPISGGSDTEPQPKEGEGEGGTPPTPQFLAVDEFKRFEATIGGQFRQVSEMLQGLQASVLQSQARGQAPAPAPPDDEITDDELEKAIATGEGSAKAVRRAIYDTARRLVKGRIEPMEKRGTQAISNLVRDAVRPRMPHYERFKDEVNQLLAEATPEQLLDPNTHLFAYNAVVGVHADELAAEAREAAIRQAATGEGKDSGAVPTGRRPAGDAVPTVRELLGEDAARALEGKSQTGDDFARRLGYKGGWPEYVRVVRGDQAKSA